MTSPLTFEDETAARFARRPWPTTSIRPGVEVSFEFFPPATQAGEANLAACAAQLEPLGPKFVSVTYGAGGTTQDRTQARYPQPGGHHHYGGRRPPDMCRRNPAASR